MKKVFLAVYDKKANTRNENPEINLQKMWGEPQNFRDLVVNEQKNLKKS
jgi:hypothetical protein